MLGAVAEMRRMAYESEPLPIENVIMSGRIWGAAGV